jgi:hypothetical protein
MLVVPVAVVVKLARSFVHTLKSEGCVVTAIELPAVTVNGKMLKAVIQPI